MESNLGRYSAAREYEPQLELAERLLGMCPSGTGASHRAWALNAVGWAQVRLGPAHEQAALALGDGLGPYSLADTWHTLGGVRSPGRRRR
ncbi:hypothetical protein ACWD4N_25765 [Streptomyces sp. NPDC002586]